MTGAASSVPPPAGVGWNTRLVDVLGESASQLERHRGLRTVGDLLEMVPRRYLDVGTSGRLAELPLGEPAVLVATVQQVTTRQMRARRGRMLEAVIEDADGELASLVFFSAYGHEDRLRQGARGLFRGSPREYRGRLQLAHPDYTILDDGDEGVYTHGLVPLYPHIPRVTDLQLTMALQLVLDQLDLGPDPLPAHLLERHRLMGRQETYRALHLPTSQEEIGRARRRRRYDEALVVQTVLAQRRAVWDEQEAVPRRPGPGGLLAAFDERLPFELTQGQRRVGEEIAADLARTRPMHRLLQGEVGSGKTVVALRAMLAAVDAGAQAALLAPTEVLAQQHHRSMTRMLGDLAEGGLLGGAEQGTRVALLTGSMTRAQKERALLDVVTGEAGIVVGTHALLQEQVTFHDLGLVVVDEQHRFGVEQRDALRDKATRAPHLLVMTATPIPRTVAMTVFGDLDTSVLGELPGGRAPIASHVVPADRPAWLSRVWERLAEEARQGHQAYVVCPRIGDDDAAAGTGPDEPGPADPAEQAGASGPAAASGAAEQLVLGEPSRPKAPLHGVLETVERLRAEPALAGLRVEVMHGRLPVEEKDAVMAAFAAGEVDVLVSTTVVEVGVDVPNSTVMVVLDADRFGISQLHQLRGRVGRGSAGGLCLLVTATDSPETLERLEAVAATTDGFALAELDLELRREGDVLGASQSGARSQLLLRLTHRSDVELIGQARADAAEIVEQDPQLREHPGLAQMVRTRLDDEQAAFLERG